MTNFLYDGDRVYAEYDEDWELVARYTTEGPSYFDPLISMRRGEISRFYVVDQVGSVRALTNSAQNVTDAYAYDAFGNPISSTGSTVNPYKYVGALGYYTNSSTSLLHVGARYYRPEVGRFVTRDPVGSWPDRVDFQGWTLAPAGSECAAIASSEPPVLEGHHLDGTWVTGFELGEAEAPPSYTYAANRPSNLVDATGHNPAAAAARAALAAAAKIAAQAAKWLAPKAKCAWKTCKKIRCSIKREKADHYFPHWPGENKWRRHVRVTCWLKGVKASKFLEIQIPF